MKCFLLLCLTLVSIASHGQVSGTAAQDTSAVLNLLRLSKQNQWKDPYVSLDYAEKALALAQQFDFKEGIARAKNLRGFSFWTFGDNDLAIRSAREALDEKQGPTSTLVRAEGYYVIARAYMDVAERSRAWEMIRLAEQYAGKGDDWELMCSIYNLMGVIQYIANKPDSALYYYQRAFNLGKRHQVDSINFPRIISNIGESFAVENPKLAFTYFNQAMDLAKKTGNRIAEASIGDIMGHAYLRGNDIKNAEIFLNDALELARRLGLRRVIRHSYSGLVDIRLRQGRGGEAVVYLRRYYEVRDSLLNTTKMREIVEMEAAHALELKEHNIRILESEKRIQTIWNNLLVGGLVAIVLLSVALYQWQRYRYRKNSKMLDLEIDLLTQQHQEARHLLHEARTETPGEAIESHDQKFLRKAISTVDLNLGDPAFSVEKMASEMSMSRTSLHRKVKTITGFPPSELIRSIRLRKAAKLILSKADTVTQIALHVGFDDYAHFSKSFKKQFGVPPTQYEDQVKQKNEEETA